MRIATWNVNGIRAREAQLLAFVEKEKPDVLALQEIKANPEQVPQALCALEGYTCFWHGARAYSGVALLVRRELNADPRFFHPAFDTETRVVAANIGPLTIASVYVPNGGKDYPAKLAFLEALGGWAGELEGREAVLLGDMNVTRTDSDVHPKERKPNAIGQREDERALFEKLMGHGFADVSRALDPGNVNLFTWWPPWREMRKRNIGWRIDYVLASGALAKRVTASSVAADVGTSDHAPVLADLSPS